MKISIVNIHILPDQAKYVILLIQRFVEAVNKQTLNLVIVEISHNFYVKFVVITFKNVNFANRPSEQ